MEEKVSPGEILSQVFPGIADSQVGEIVASGKVVEYPGDCILCREGALETTFYIILSGHVRVTKQLISNQERVLKQLGPGDFFGEMAILHNAPRSATVTTIEPITVMEIRKESFTGMIERNSSVTIAIVREVSQRLRENDEMAIGDLRLKARELADAYQQLAEEEFARSQFLTTASHELRTPLMAANGYLQGIRMGMFEGEAQKDALEKVWNNLQEVISLTNDILFLQEMELILPEFHSTDVPAVARAAVEQELPASKRIGAAIRLEAEPGLPSIPGDAKSLQRAIAAVLDNAVKFSPDGGEVLVKICRVEGDPAAVSLTIQDHGVGIPKDAIPRIFERFFHLDIICGRVFRGIGLGLSIARQVIEQHRGSIRVESELGKGSTFTILLNKQS